MGDMNAKVGKESFRSVGPESLHQTSNNNGLRLASFAEANNMIIGGTWFPHKKFHKYTWESPDGRTRNQIDHILVDAKHRGALQDVRCYRGADCSTDHLLLTAKVKARLKLEKKMRNEPQRKFETERLKQLELSNQYQLEIRNRYEVLMMTEEEEMDMEEEAKMLVECIIKSAEEIIGCEQNNRREEWYDEECASAVEERKKARQKWQQTRSEEDKEDFIQKRRNAKRVKRRKKREFMNNNLDKIETLGREGKIREQYAVIKKVRNGYRPRVNMVIHQNGVIATREEEILSCWKKFFKELLNRPEPDTPYEEANDDNINEEEVREPTINEVGTAIKELKNNKAPGEDGVVGELLKAGGEYLKNKIYQLILRIWREEKVPRNRKKGIIIPILKKEIKGYVEITEASHYYLVYTKFLQKYFIGD
ncbi:uncharacterized protein LOC143033551 [Oratosquilla oratoria]|uniref:uncharacterized protein LOC143033551 n=1 Tax=Oratosquilla oratoria TaxID=337810 RepID=UPI003F773609